MGTSKGQCCNICVTTRSYNNDGKQLSQNSFDTDTIDMYVYSGDIHLIGNSFLSFQYLDNIKPIGTGVNHNYIVPFKTNVYNYNNYRCINNKNQYTKQENNNHILSNKTLGYINSCNFYEYSGGLSFTPNSVELSHKHSYPFELYQDNTKIARIFANSGCLFIIKDNKIFEYSVTGENNELVNISFFNKTILNPTFDGTKIYVGEKTYNYGNIEFNQHTKFISGAVVDGTTDNLNICFNYPFQYYPTGNFGGVNGTVVSNSKLVTDSLIFNFLSGNLQLRAANTGCYYENNFLQNNDYFWYGAITSGLNQDNEYVIYNKILYDNNTTPACEPIYYSGWLCNNIQSQTNRVVANFIKQHDIISSGDLYYEYHNSVFNGPTIPTVGSGYVSTWVGEYNTLSRITTVKQINVDNILNRNFLLNQFNYISGYTQDYMFGFYDFDSGNLIRKNKVVGDWKIIDYDYEINYHSNDKYLVSLTPNVLIRDYSYDSAFNEPSGQGYSFMRSSFYLAKHTVTYPTSLDITCSLNRVEWKTGIFGNQAIYFIDNGIAVGPPITESSYDKEGGSGPITNWNHDSSSWSLYQTFPLADYEISLQINNVAHFYNLHNSTVPNFILLPKTGNWDFASFISFDRPVGNATTFLEFYVPTEFAGEANALTTGVGSTVIMSGGLRDYIFPGIGGTTIPYNVNCLILDRNGAKISCVTPEITGVVSTGYWMFEPKYNTTPGLCSLYYHYCNPCANTNGTRWLADYYFLSNTTYSIGDGCGGVATGVDFWSHGYCPNPPNSGDHYARYPLIVIDGYALGLPNTGYLTYINNQNCSWYEWNCNHLASSIFYCPPAYITALADSGNFIGPTSGYSTFLAGNATNYNIPNYPQGDAPFVISYTTVYKHPFEANSARMWPENIGMDTYIPAFNSVNQIYYNAYAYIIGEFESKRFYSINMGGTYTSGGIPSFGPLDFGKLDYSIPNGMNNGRLAYSNIFTPFLVDNELPIKVNFQRNGSWHLASPSVTYNHTSGGYMNLLGRMTSFNTSLGEELYGIIDSSNLYVLENRYKTDYV